VGRPVHRCVVALGVQSESASGSLFKPQASHDGFLAECAHVVQEVIGMQAYDREVLVREVEWSGKSFDLFFRHRMYNCQATERSAGR